MNKPILISRGVKPLRPLFVEQTSPKQYPFWDELVLLLGYEGYETRELTEMPLPELEATIKDALCVICPDSFIQHFCWSVGVKAVVLWGYGDPQIFGHKENINLLKSRAYLRPDQFNIWEGVPCRKDIWVTPGIVIKTIQENFK
jgi:hypothetical protein